MRLLQRKLRSVRIAPRAAEDGAEAFSKETRPVRARLVPVAGGSGFGVFLCILLALCLLFIMAEYAMTWLLTPVAITMTLLQSETLWWILPTAARRTATVR